MTKQVWQPKHLPYQIDIEERGGFYENLWKQVGFQLLAKHFAPEPARTILDYGSGRGESLQIFGQAGFAVTGADVDPECVKLSSRFGKACVLNPNDPVGQFGPKSFDAVVCFHVLEHVDSPKKTLGELSRIAKKYVLIAVPNLRLLQSWRARQFRLSQVNEGHLQSWDHWHLRNLAERYCGLELVEWGSDATQLPILSGLSRRLLGNRMTIRLETGIFRKFFPYHCASVIGLFRVV